MYDNFTFTEEMHSLHTLVKFVLPEEINTQSLDR